MTFLQKPTHILILLLLLATITITPVAAIESITPDFTNSIHVLKNTEKINGYYYYLQKPTTKTIIDYIFTQIPTFKKYPFSTGVIINLAGYHPIRNDVYIAYTRSIDPYIIDNCLTQTNLTPDQIVTQLDTLPNELLIAKNTNTVTFIDIKKIRELKQDIKSLNFKWISTCNVNSDNYYWYNTIWGPTYRP